MVGDESLSDTATAGSTGISLGDTNTLKTTVPSGSIWYVDKAIVDGDEPIRASVIVDENNISNTVGEFWRSLIASARVNSVAPSLDGSTVYLGSNDSNAYAVDATDGSQIWTSTVASGGVSSVAPSPDGSKVYIGTNDIDAHALDATDGSQIWTSSVATFGVNSVAPSPDGSTVYLGGNGNNAYALVKTPLGSGGRSIKRVGTGELGVYAYGGDTIAVGVNFPSKDVGFRLGIREVVSQ